MIELELKAVVRDLDALLRRFADLGAREEFIGSMQDVRFDSPEGRLLDRDQSVRVRVYRHAEVVVKASLDWKGPSSRKTGYKQREELNVACDDPDTLITILGKLGYRVASVIDRHIWQFKVGGASVRVERYPRMDDLVEVEGDPSAIEAAISVLGIPRSEFVDDALTSFVRRFEQRAGWSAVLSRGATDA